MADKEEQGTEQKPGMAINKKLLMIIGGALGAVILVVVAVLLFSGGGKKPEGGEAKKEAAKGKEGKEGEKPVANSFAMEPYVVNIYDGQELRYLKVKVELELSTPADKVVLESRQAQLRDAILVMLTTKTLQDIQDLQGKNQLRDEILTAVNRIIQPTRVLKVFFTDFVVQ